MPNAEPRRSGEDGTSLTAIVAEAMRTKNEITFVDTGGQATNNFHKIACT